MLFSLLLVLSTQLEARVRKLASLMFLSESRPKSQLVQISRASPPIAESILPQRRPKSKHVACRIHCRNELNQKVQSQPRALPLLFSSRSQSVSGPTRSFEPCSLCRTLITFLAIHFGKISFTLWLRWALQQRDRLALPGPSHTSRWMHQSRFTSPIQRIDLISTLLDSTDVD